MLASPIRHDFVKTSISLAHKLTPETVRQTIGDLENQALAVMRQEGFEPSNVILNPWVEMRYVGQAHELPIRPLNPQTLAAPQSELPRLLHEAHRFRYGFALERNPVEVVKFGLTAVGKLREFSCPPARVAKMQKDGGKIEERTAWFEHRQIAVPVFLRDRLPTEAVVRGPAIVESDDSTTLIPPGGVATLDQLGTMRLDLG